MLLPNGRRLAPLPANVSVGAHAQTLHMDAFHWFELFAHVSPRRVVSIVAFTYVGLLYLHFEPAWDLFDWAVQLRVRQIMDSLPIAVEPPAAR